MAQMDAKTLNRLHARNTASIYTFRAKEVVKQKTVAQRMFATTVKTIVLITSWFSIVYMGLMSMVGG